MWKTRAKLSHFWHHFGMESLQSVTTRVREIVNFAGMGLDKAIDQALEEAFETGVLIHHEGNSLHSQIRANILGLGKLDELIHDPNIEEIWINAPESIFVANEGVSRKLELTLTELEVRQVVEKMLRDSGRRLDRTEPFVDATLADGSRLHVVIPEVTREHWAVNIRKFPTKVYSLQDLVNLGSLSQVAADYLATVFREGKNFLVSGATQAGKTTMLCALLDCGALTERLISVEETFEIRTNYIDWVPLQARQANLEGVGEITLRKLVREALRMRPTRLVVGEVRQAEALDLLIALNSGIAGLSTIHANSALEALQKLKLLPLLAGENIPARFVEETVNRAIDVVIHCTLYPDGSRAVAEILRSDFSTGDITWKEIEF